MQLALIGTGLMGRPMAERLIAAGHALAAYNRTRSKAEALRPLGARIADTPAAAVAAAECIILMLSDGAAIRDTLLATDTTSHLHGRTVIQMSTISPGESRAIAAAVHAAGGDYFEAPVLGSIAEVKAGTLIVMVGGTPAQFERWSALLRSFGPEPLLVGPVGHAATLKLALNQLIASLTTAFTLSLGLVQRAGIDVELFMRVLRQSALYAPTFDRKLPRLLERNYADPNFPTKHLLKDVTLILGEAQAHGLSAPSLEGVQRLLQATIAQGLGEVDYSALTEVVNPETSTGSQVTCPS